ncbi:hypothetical protein HDU76_002493, partial [Blyttiomyces sp. JEL0837]
MRLHFNVQLVPVEVVGLNSIPSSLHGTLNDYMTNPVSSYDDSEPADILEQGFLEYQQNLGKVSYGSSSLANQSSSINSSNLQHVSTSTKRTQPSSSPTSSSIKAASQRERRSINNNSSKKSASSTPYQRPAAKRVQDRVKDAQGSAHTDIISLLFSFFAQRKQRLAHIRDEHTKEVYTEKNLLKKAFDKCSELLSNISGFSNSIDLFQKNIQTKTGLFDRFYKTHGDIFKHTNNSFVNSFKDTETPIRNEYKGVENGSHALKTEANIIRNNVNMVLVLKELQQLDDEVVEVNNMCTNGFNLRSETIDPQTGPQYTFITRFFSETNDKSLQTIKRTKKKYERKVNELHDEQTDEIDEWDEAMYEKLDSISQRRLALENLIQQAQQSLSSIQQQAGNLQARKDCVDSQQRHWFSWANQ